MCVCVCVCVRFTGIQLFHDCQFVLTETITHDEQKNQLKNAIIGLNLIWGHKNIHNPEVFRETVTDEHATTLDLQSACGSQ